MKVGVTLFCQNYEDWERFSSGDFARPARTPDARLWEEDLRIGDLVEPLGFDSLWGVEHHFTPYTMIPDVLQFLTYFAGRTERVDMGTMVVVLPWDQPVRIAERIAMLDILLKGRTLSIGFGRGAGQVEFKGFNLAMGESRGRFLEGLEIVRRALSSERFSYDGQFWQVPETGIRPRPRSTDLAQRMYCAWGSPETLEIAANAGLGMLFIPQKSWEEYGQDVENFNAIRARQGWSPMQPKVVCWVYCAETEAAAHEAALTYMGNYNDSARRHYEFDDAAHFRAAGGYDYYAKMSEMRTQYDPAVLKELFVRSQVWGTPEQCIEKLRAIQRTTSASEFIGVFKYGAMPLAEAERSMRLFAEAVLPAIHQDEVAAAAAAAPVS